MFFYCPLNSVTQRWENFLVGGRITELWIIKGPYLLKSKEYYKFIYVYLQVFIFIFLKASTGRTELCSGLYVVHDQLFAHASCNLLFNCLQSG